ncbi:MAG: outer membrane lipoprotein carrier protein LolA [Terrimicrobiaceae bacterium]
MRNLLIVLLAASGLNAQELSSKEVEALLARLSESRAGAAMQADFREERRLALMNKPVVETGTVSFLPPDKFRRQVDNGTLTLCDGDVLWLYYPQFGEAEKYTLSSNRSLRESIAAMTSGFGLQNLSKNYNVQARKTANGYRATLTPKTSSLRKTVAEIQVDISSELFAKRLEIAGADGDRTLVTFSNERRVSLSPEDFEFQPPQGVRVSEPLR